MAQNDILSEKRLFITHKYLTFYFQNQNGQKSISKYWHNQKCVVVVEIIYGRTETFFLLNKEIVVERIIAGYFGFR